MKHGVPQDKQTEVQQQKVPRDRQEEFYIESLDTDIVHQVKQLKGFENEWEDPYIHAQFHHVPQQLHAISFVEVSLQVLCDCQHTLPKERDGEAFPMYKQQNSH